MKKVTASLAAAMLCVGLAGPAAAATYSLTYPDVPKTIAEGDWVYADILVGGGLGNITDVNVFVDITHTWIGDLDIYLVHQQEGGASEKWVQLYNGDPAEFRTNMTNVLFDDQATTYINDAAPPYGPGSYKPGSNGPDTDDDPINNIYYSNLLSFFNGDQAAGMWSLALFDNSGGDIGTLEAFRLDIETDATQNAVPLPGAILLFGSGLGVLAAVRRVRQK